MATGRIEMGPTARTVAANLRRLREARGMSLRTLSAELKKVGRTLSADAINKIENGRELEHGAAEPKQIRRADVDDLVALALVLNVSPAALLLPPTSGDQLVKLTEAYAIPSRTAWQWAEGQRTAMDYEPGPIAGSGPGGDPAIVLEKYEREQEFSRRQAEYKALTHPPERRRGSEYQAVRLGRDLADLVEDIVSPEPGADSSVLAARGRMAKRRYVQLGLELDDIIEQLPPVHAGVPVKDVSMSTTEAQDVDEQWQQAEREALKKAVEEAKKAMGDQEGEQQ